jgi:hypothetical protein
MSGMIFFVNERDPPPVTEQPAVQVQSWRLFQAANGDRHLLAILDHGAVRTTSAIISFDPASAELTTQSGRKYQVLSPPEARQPQLTMLTANALRAGLVDALDLSDTLWQLVAKQ